MANSKPMRLVVGLHVVAIAVTDETVRVLLTRRRSPREGLGDALPFGRLHQDEDRTLELGLRRAVRDLAGVELGYVEQLYTFGDMFRGAGQPNERVLSIGYLALVREGDIAAGGSLTFRDCYALFPWEDWREGEPKVLRTIVAGLKKWASTGADSRERRSRRQRVDLLFGRSVAGWDGERVLERFELLYEAGMVRESRRDAGPEGEPAAGPNDSPSPPTGESLRGDDRRILATALGRLRGKIRYRPLVFELMPETFTLLQLQRVVEALSGTRLHKQNFRRVLEKARLVEGTGVRDRSAGGRPAERFRFRAEVARERKVTGVALPRLPGPVR